MKTSSSYLVGADVNAFNRALGRIQRVQTDDDFGSHTDIQDVVEKFWKCAAFSVKPLSYEKLDTFLSRMKTLEQAADARCLARLLF